MVAPKHRLALAATTLALALSAGCGKSEPPEPPPMPAPAPVGAMTITIDHSDFGVTPPIVPGAVVTVVNKDLVRHSITSERSGLFDYEVAAQQSITFIAPSEPGVHPFHCRYHGLMESALTVRQ